MNEIVFTLGADVARGVEGINRFNTALASTGTTAEQSSGRARDSLGRFVSASSEAGATAATAAAKARSFSDALSSIEKEAGKLGLSLSASLTLPIGAIAALGIGFNVMEENALTGFTTMLGSAQSAQSFLDEMKDFAAQTPFEFPDLIRASQRMLAMGIAAGDVKTTLTAVGDAAAALGGGAETINGLTTALGQMQAKGKITAEEMMQLTERGVPAWDILAKKIGTDIPGAMALVRQGAVSAKVGVEALVQGMEDRFGGLMSKASQNFTGLLSTIKDTASMIAADALKPVFQLAEQGLKAFADVLPDLKAFIAGLSPEVLALATGFSLVAAAAGPVALAVAGIAAVVGTLSVPVVAAVGAVGALAGALLAFPDFRDAVTGVIGDVIDWVRNLTSSNSEASTMVRDAWTAVKDSVEPIFARISELFGLALDTMKAASDSFGPFIVGAFQNTWETIVGLVAPAWDIITGVVSAALDNVIGILKVFGGIVTLNWDLAWEGMKQSLSGVWSAIVSVVGNGAVALLNTVESMIGGFANLANAVGANGIAGALNTAKSAVDTFSDELSDLVNAHRSHKTAVDASANAVKDVREAHSNAITPTRNHTLAVADNKDALKLAKEEAKAAKREYDDLVKTFKEASMAVYDNKVRLKELEDANKFFAPIQRDSTFAIREYVDATQDAIAATIPLTAHLNTAAQAANIKILMTTDPQAQKNIDDFLGSVQKASDDAKARAQQAVADVESAAGDIFNSMFLKGENVFSSLGSMLKGGALSLGQAIFEDISGALLGPVKQAFDDFFKKHVTDVIKEHLGGALTGIFGGGSSAAAAASGAAGAAGDAGGSGLGGLASGAGGTVSMITGIVGALGSVISAIGTLRLEGTMNAVEYNTRVSSIHLGVIIDQLLWPMRGVLDSFATDQGGLIAQLNEIRDASWRTATNTQGIYDNIRGIADNGAFGASSQVDDTWKRILGVMEELLKITHDTGREMLTALQSIDEHILGLMAPLNRIAGWDAFKLPLNANAGSLDPMKYMSDGHGLILPLPKFHDGGISTREGLAIVDKDELHIPAKVWKRNAQQKSEPITVNVHFNGPVIGDYDKLADVLRDKLNRIVRSGGRLVASEVQR